MKLATLASLCVLLSAPTCLAQAGGAMRIAEAGPYPDAAPGQIMEPRVAVRATVEDRGAAGYGAPAAGTFQPAERR